MINKMKQNKKIIVNLKIGKKKLKLKKKIRKKKL